MPINQGNKIYKYFNFFWEFFFIVNSWIHWEVDPLGENMAVLVKGCSWSVYCASDITLNAYEQLPHTINSLSIEVEELA